MSPHQGLPVDDEGGRAADTEGTGLTHVGLHRLGEPPFVETPLEAVLVEPEGDGVGDEVVPFEARLFREAPIVIRPVLAQAPGAARGLVGGAGQGMGGQREILEDEPEAARVFTEELVQRPLDALAVRSLIVGKLDDGHRRPRCPLRHEGVHGESEIVGAGRRRDQQERQHVVHSRRSTTKPGAEQAGERSVHHAQNTTRRGHRATGVTMGLLLRTLINTGDLLLAAHVVPGVQVTSFLVALVAGLVLGLINAVIRPILVLLTLPFTLLTLGLFLFVLNALCLWLTSALVPGFTVPGFWAAFLAALIVSAVSWVLTAFLNEAGQWKRI